MKKQNKKILMIDDDADMLEIGKIIIQRAGFEYCHASSSEEGFAKILSQEPNLIILDYMMPEMNGLTFFQEFRQKPEYKQYRDTPVIMLTARNDEHIDQKFLFEKGLSAFLIKPFGHRELINVIENVLNVAEIRLQNVELEEEIKRTRYKYRDLIENANDLIFMLTKDGKVDFVNRQLNGLTNLKPKYWLEHFLMDLVIPQDKTGVEKAITKCLEGLPHQFQMRVRDRDNSILYFATSLNPLLENELVTGMVGIARDVTEKYQLESRISNLESFTESIIKSMGTGLITVNQNRRVTFYNSAAEDILGYKTSEVLNKVIDDILPEYESKILLPADHKINRAMYSQEMEISHSDGSKVHIGFSYTPWIDSFNNFLGSIITFRDISETKQMQIEMVRMDRLASLGVLAAGIAHEIRNPLAGIKTMAQTLEEEVKKSDPHQEYLQRIIRQVNRLDELLKSFFSYARPKPPVKKLHQIQDVVHEVSVLLGKRVASNNVKFEESYSEDLKLVFVDLNQIQQVFLNLIINALDAMPNGGELKISAKNIKARSIHMDRRGRSYQTQRKISFIEITILDSGIGIRPEHLDTIFDPFFTTKSQGTGLGLSIVYRIIEEHGGEISASSELGKSSKFKILLPTEE